MFAANRLGPITPVQAEEDTEHIGIGSPGLPEMLMPQFRNLQTTKDMLIELFKKDRKFYERAQYVNQKKKSPEAVARYLLRDYGCYCHPKAITNRKVGPRFD